ncbi:ParB N-terminal domain-containing protein [Cohnella faecalis]|uniref:ParB/RepB/Spo0J family partition protein n=1 Tax=Cohnella faecalis TaxID=2315694 RepID=A0A398CEC7_9BACL|nr:ParB/RepB/Spo0J family partition protein [Cohnella faecalis]RIE01526.1 ParB/RepB/Spo0J family partition protein [Cohnella faecalis]
MKTQEPFLENEQARLLYRITKTESQKGSYNVFIQDRLKNKPVYKVPIDLLRYNDNNFRIRHQVDYKVESEGITLIDEDIEDQTWIEDILNADDPDVKRVNTFLSQSIKKYGQKDPVIVRLADAVVVDGNRRLMTLNKLVLEGNAEFKVVDAVIIDEELTDIEWLELEARYQYEKDAKSEYDNINEAKMLKKLYDIYNDYDAVAKRVQSRKSHVEMRIATLSLIDSYLEKLGSKNNYSRISSFTLFEELAKEQEKRTELTPTELHELEVTGLNVITLKSVIEESNKKSRLVNGVKEDDTIDDRIFRKMLKTFTLEPAKSVLTQTVKGDSLLSYEEIKAVKNDFKNDVSTAILIQEAHKQAKEPLRMINLAISHLKSIQNLKGNARNPIVTAIGDVTRELNRIRQMLMNEQS